jgi:hypothetical protein
MFHVDYTRLPGTLLIEHQVTWCRCHAPVPPESNCDADLRCHSQPRSTLVWHALLLFHLTTAIVSNVSCGPGLALAHRARRVAGVRIQAQSTPLVFSPSQRLEHAGCLAGCCLVC